MASIFRTLRKFSDAVPSDTMTLLLERLVVVGKDSKVMIMIPYEADEESTITPITIHATNRQQIRYRVKSGRYQNE